MTCCVKMPCKHESQIETKPNFTDIGYTLHLFKANFVILFNLLFC